MHWLRSLLLGRRIDREMRAEMEQHIERATERIVAGGMSLEQAPITASTLCATERASAPLPANTSSTPGAAACHCAAAPRGAPSTKIRSGLRHPSRSRTGVFASSSWWRSCTVGVLPAASAWPAKTAALIAKTIAADLNIVAPSARAAPRGGCMRSRIRERRELWIQGTLLSRSGGSRLRRQGSLPAGKPS